MSGVINLKNGPKASWSRLFLRVFGTDQPQRVSFGRHRPHVGKRGDPACSPTRAPQVTRGH